RTRRHRAGGPGAAGRPRAAGGGSRSGRSPRSSCPQCSRRASRGREYERNAAQRRSVEHILVLEIRVEGVIVLVIGARVLQLQDGQALAQRRGLQGSAVRRAERVVRQAQDEQVAKVRRRAHGPRRGGSQAVLAQVQFEQGVGGRRVGQQRR